MRRKDRQPAILGATLFALAIANFLSFTFMAGRIGGDAFGGKVADGHYFVGEHGRLTEVSERTWRYSRCHAISIWITHPLGILSAIVFSRRFPFVVDPRKLAKGRPTAWETFRGRGSSR